MNPVVEAFEQAIAIVGRAFTEGGSRQEIYEGIISDLRARISIAQDKAKASRRLHAGAQPTEAVNG